MPRQVEDVGVVVSLNNALRFGFPDENLAVLARRGQHGAIGGPCDGCDVGQVAVSEAPLLLPVVLGDDLNVLGGRGHGKGPPVRMPYGSGGHLGLGVYGTDDAVHLAYQLGLVRGQRVDVDDAVGARYGREGALGIEADVSGGAVVLAQRLHLRDVARVDYLDAQLVACHGAPPAVGGQRDVSDGQRGPQQETLKIGRGE